ncbi:hypothetical protein LOZ80_05970 [Paenibacillus sp. HWE-109]|uniref:hypothetical protein n=1 Tax=Paenibacillus sp. HWE-109 TaxID=1306526 RepID=UPI001EDCA925|nr:hypothetical protein [Paenibacillus sp. HWE-109]UKS28480.1 hypothetical protein LOZ80_05970 [Paenibacillus sp. HWE-109]
MVLFGTAFTATIRLQSQMMSTSLYPIRCWQLRERGRGQHLKDITCRTPSPAIDSLAAVKGKLRRCFGHPVSDWLRFWSASRVSRVKNGVPRRLLCCGGFRSQWASNELYDAYRREK